MLIILQLCCNSIYYGTEACPAGQHSCVGQGMHQHRQHQSPLASVAAASSLAPLASASISLSEET